MIALLLAATAALSPHQHGLSVAPETVCKGEGAIQTSFEPEPALLLRPEDRAAIAMKRLGDLPRANLEIAVVRTVNGCSTPVVVSFEIEEDGRFAVGGK